MWNTNLQEAQRHSYLPLLVTIDRSGDRYTTQAHTTLNGNWVDADGLIQGDDRVVAWAELPQPFVEEAI